ncbi:MAG TPA: L-threonylcarbamoyladenylate synthase [Ignavibacteriaceae bacterium]|nr:L-threonylcarbamoyladenylate synthase [Ignavibacteriaceae bacterium]
MVREAICINIDEEFDRSIEEARRLFLAGQIFIYPTDTLYGIGGNPFDKSVILRINELKQRNELKHFILLINNIKNLIAYVEFSSDKHVKILQNLWPGPVTVIFRTNSNAAEQLDSKTIAFRVPNNKFCLNLLSQIKMPLISTSVNKSEETPILDYVEINEKFKSKVDAIFYTKQKRDNIPSTIVDLTEKEPKIIREGKIKVVELLRKFN